MNMDQSVCTASLSSQTYALKAQKALANAAIMSRVVRLDASKSKKGCSYGIEFSCGHLHNVENILRQKNIRIRALYSGDIEL